MQMQSSKLVRKFIYLAAFAAGCSSASVTSDAGTTPTGDGGMIGTGMSFPLTPDMTGYVDIMANTAGVKGSWYAYGDGLGPTGMPPGDCQMANHPTSACSAIAMPSPGSFANTGGKMCTNGTVAQVVGMVSMPTMPDYAKIWGAGIGLDLNNDGIAPKAAFDASSFVGFSFDLDPKPMPGLRVEVETTSTVGSVAGNDYWGAGPAYPNSPVVVGNNVVKWTDIKGPMGHVFDPKELRGLQFHVPTTTTGAAPYSFCISNLKLLK